MNIVITGASCGIGYETAKQFAKKPSNSVIVISRNQNNLEKLKRECLLQNENSKVFIKAMDLAQISGYSQLASDIKVHFQHIDVLINNAGTLINKPFKSISKEDLESTYKVNVFAPFMLIQSLLPLLAKATHPQIINLGSMGGITGSAKFAGLSAYSSSKGAISILSECLAEELKEYNIRVNCLALGAVNTEMLQKAFPGYLSHHEPAEIAEFIENFAINCAPLFNGKTIPLSTSTP